MKQIKVALCSIAKNENLYIREWIEYYKNLGIYKIFIYDNNDIEGEHFEDIINDYIDSTYVSIIDFRGKIRTNISDKDGLCMQGVAYKDCLDNNWKNFDFICFFDIDEFLCIDKKYKSLNEFLNDFIDYDGIKVQWRCYGDNNQILYENKPVLERFKHKKNYSYDKHIKTILRCKDYSNYDLKFCAHGPLNRDLNIVNLHKIISTNPYIDNTNNGIAYTDLPVYLDHFYSKSTDEFFRRKYKQTSAVTGINETRNFNLSFLMKQYFATNQKTEEKVNYINSFKDNYKSVNVYMASLYSDGYVINSIKSIINEPEVNKVYLSANNYTIEQINNVISSIHSNKLNIIRTDNKKKSNEKLKYVWSTPNSKYVAFCDDDLIYPRNYFYDMITTYNNIKNPVSCHGSRLTKFPMTHYYKERQGWSFNRIVKNTIEVDVFGNGVSLFERNCFTNKEWKDLYDNSPEISMDDIIVSCALHKKGYKTYVMKHKYNYIIEKSKEDENYKNRVYELYKQNCEYQTNYINKNFIRLSNTNNTNINIKENTTVNINNNTKYYLPEIDYVVTYVDNNDIKWLKSYINCSLKHKKQVFLKSARFRTPNTLKYHLRGVAKYMPWIRNLYLIVSNDSQVPEWINKKNVKIIYHKDYIPQQFLPTFNSNTIEMFMWKIKGLSDNFIYANDDIYINHDLKKSDFFDAYNCNIKANIGYLNLNNTNTVFQNMLRNTQEIIFDDLGMIHEDKVLKSDHSIKPLKKYVFKYFFDKYTNKMNNSITPFRHDNNITLELCNFYFYLTNQYSLKSTNDVYTEYKDDNINEIIQDIKNPNIDTLCINDVTSFKGNYEEYNKKLIEAFEEKFPNKSKYEL